VYLHGNVALQESRLLRGWEAPCINGRGGSLCMGRRVWGVRHVRTDRRM